MTDIPVPGKKKKIFYIKIFLDIFLSVIWTVLMVYRITGAFWHEWIGLFAIGLIVIHNLLNASWIVRMSRMIFTSRFTISSFRYIIAFLLLVLTLFSGFSGILIAKKIVFPISASDYSLWIFLHHLSSYALIIIISIHIGIHGKMVISICRNIFRIKNDSKTRKFILRVLALAVMMWGVKASLEYKIPLPSEPGDNKIHTKKSSGSDSWLTLKPEETTGTQAADKELQDKEDLEKPDITVDNAAELEDFLSNLYCTGCHRHCSLLAPQCVTGDIQAETATEEFEAGNDITEMEETVASGTLSLETFSSGNGSTKESASLLDIVPIMGFWILGAHYFVRLADHRKSVSPKKKN